MKTNGIETYMHLVSVGMKQAIAELVVGSAEVSFKKCSQPRRVAIGFDYCSTPATDPNIRRIVRRDLKGDMRIVFEKVHEVRSRARRTMERTVPHIPQRDDPWVISRRATAHSNRNSSRLEKCIDPGPIPGPGNVHVRYAGGNEVKPPSAATRNTRALSVDGRERV